jgi:DNA invertase Pin-like site-specific DNA recombinase
MNCILYARVSTDKQAEKDLSMPAQLQLMRDYARQHDWTVVEEFLEPGASAITAQRPELQRLLARVKDGEPKVDVVVVHKLDRMARNIEDHVAIRASLKRADVRLASVAENVDESVSGQLVENIMASIAQFYSANLGEEARKGMRQKVLKGGWPHKPPRGYVTVRNEDGRGSRLELHRRDSALMRSAFELYATGHYSVKALAQRLANDGLTAKSGRPVAMSYLRRLLANPFYAGRIR